MAIQSVGILGRVSGRVGDKIGYIKNGKQYWRNSPKKQNQASLDAMNELNLERAKFLSSYLFPFKFCYIKSATKVKPDKLEPTPIDLHDFIPGASDLDEKGQWDKKFSKVIFCTHNGEDFLDPKLTWQSNMALKLTWNMLSREPMILADFFMCAPELAKTEELQELIHTGDATIITLPEPIDTRVPHMYACSFVSADGLRYQQYLGTIEPAKTLKIGSLWEVMV